MWKFVWNSYSLTHQNQYVKYYFSSVVVCVSVYVSACVNTYTIILPNSGSPDTPSTSDMTTCLTYIPIAGQRSLSWSSGGSFGFVDCVVNRHRQNITITIIRSYTTTIIITHSLLLCKYGPWENECNEDNRSSGRVSWIINLLFSFIQ